MRSPAAYSGNLLIANLLGAAVTALLLMALTSASVPVLSSDRTIFFALVVLGMAMCAFGGVGRAPAKYGWTHPVTLFGVAVGTLLLLLVGGVLTGQVADGFAISAFAALFAVKWVVGLVFVR